LCVGRQTKGGGIVKKVIFSYSVPCYGGPRLVCGNAAHSCPPLMNERKDYPPQWCRIPKTFDPMAQNDISILLCVTVKQK
jgi:hypothetical protein